MGIDAAHVTGDEPYDLMVIGGGINGVGIARDAAGRGLNVVLVEQEDLASATSSASSKLIHGGLRYLEHLDFGFVREALAARERLLAIAPHIIRPLQFLLPHVPGLRPRWMIRLGLFFRTVLGGKLTTYRSLAESVMARLQPHLGGPRASWTSRAPLPGGEMPGGDLERFQAEARLRWPWLEERWLRRMTRSYGTLLERVLGNARSPAALGRAYGATLTEAEVRYLQRDKWAQTATDILWRRSKLGLHMTSAEREAFEDSYASVVRPAHAPAHAPTTQRPPADS